ncbi:MAG: pirin family protein [Alphaproteobacteria bacterium]|nr:MAG: pirin family protein [Alphaproteobacteria bacterium]
MTTSARAVSRVIRSVALREGEDMPVRRAFAAHGNVFVDPFLMLDHFGPLEVGADSKGFPPHPHKGFETVTYMLSGQIEHRDSTGGHAVIGPGDVQWMTAGAGIVHSETPPEDFKKAGGTVEGLQLWVNLPRAEKSTPAGYQILRAGELGRGEDGVRGVRAIVVAGEALGAKGPARTRSPMTVAVLEMDAEATLSLDPGEQANAAVYVASGSLAAGRRRHHVRAGETAVFEAGPGPIALAACEPVLALYMAGVPLNEPVVARGPFVMSTEEEIRQAMQAYQAGNFP